MSPSRNAPCPYNVRVLYGVLRRMDRISNRLNDPRVRGTQMNLCWMGWMSRFGDAMDLLPKWAYDFVADTEVVGSYSDLLPALLAAAAPTVRR